MRRFKMKSQKFRVVENMFSTDFEVGKIYTLTENGCPSSTGCIFETYLNKEGYSLYEKWCKYWEGAIKRRIIEFELVEEDVKMEKQKIRVVKNNMWSSPERRLTVGKTFTLTEEGLEDSSGCRWGVFLTCNGKTLYEKWCDYWECGIKMGVIEFELVEEPKIELKLIGIEEDEKFYILDKNGKKVVGRGHDPYFILRGELFDRNLNSLPNTLSKIIKGTLIIEKQDPEIACTELEIQKQKEVLKKLEQRLEELK